MALTNVPTRNRLLLIVKLSAEKSGNPPKMPISGVISPFTIVSTISLNAAPMTTATARSTTFPRSRNFLKPSSIRYLHRGAASRLVGYCRCRNESSRQALLSPSQWFSGGQYHSGAHAGSCPKPSHSLCHPERPSTTSPGDIPPEGSPELPPRQLEARAGASCPALTRLRQHLLADGRIRRDTRTPLASARVGGPVDPSARAMTGGAVA